MPGHVLVIDDDRSLAQALVGLLETDGHAVRHAATGEAALAAVRDEPTDLALLDLRLGAESGLDLLPRLTALRPELSVIVVTALSTVDTVVEAMKLGADNFVTKPIDEERLLALVARGIENRALRAKSAQYDRLRTVGKSALVTGSEPLRAAVAMAEAVAEHDTTVLVTGETGSGKGMLARHIHDRSPRAARPFVELNCAGLARELTESELFGHEKGAFTGAVGRKLGLFEAADGGTLFLDEIGEMELGVQAKLLKVLESRRFRRLGGLAEIACDVRLIAATHRDLAQEAAAGRFRSDLLYRLNVFGVRLPPLRERKAEIVPLARHFLAELRGERAPLLGDEAAAYLTAYDWPGNVRELRNVMERAAILCPPRAEVLLAHLPPLGGALPEAPVIGVQPVVDGPDPAARSLQDAERSYLENVLRAYDNNVPAAAKAIGVSRSTLYRKIAKHGLAT